MWTEYLVQLQAWCDSPFGLEPVRAVLTYLKKGRLIQDLVSYRILFADESGHLLKNGPVPRKKPRLFFSLFQTEISSRRLSASRLTEMPFLPTRWSGTATPNIICPHWNTQGSATYKAKKCRSPC